MFKSTIAAGFLLAFAFVIGTSTVAAQDDINTGEAFIGFMHKRSDGDGFNGINGSATYNFHKYVGAKFDVSWSKGPDSILFGRPTDTTYMGGVQFKDNSKEGSTVKPFAHVLLGGNRQSISSFSETGFTMAVGGGIDVKVSDRMSIRLIQADYQPVWVDGSSTNQTRFSFGVVFN